MHSDTAADSTVRTTDSTDCEGGDGRPVHRATRLVRLLKLVVTTLAAVFGVAKTLGLL
jgi:hypothetical protein